MAAIYVAQHRDGRKAAVKMLHPSLAVDPVSRKRFILEGHAANRVRHDGAVAILDDGVTEDGETFLVMELLSGQSLDQVLRERGPLPAPEVVAAAALVLDVLAVAHDQGVVHRDIKPSNVFRLADGGFKLLDFGIARVTQTHAPGVTQSGVSIGTPGFMAPEQAAGRNDDIDHVTDVWALGATMFQLLTGRLVHPTDSRNAAIVMAATKPAPPIRSVKPELPKALAEVVDRALAFHKEMRWPNARAMRRALLAAMPELDLPPSASEPAELEVATIETSPELSHKAGTGDVDAPQSRVPRRIQIAIGAAVLASPVLGTMLTAPDPEAARRPVGASSTSMASSAAVAEPPPRPRVAPAPSTTVQSAPAPSAVALPKPTTRSSEKRVRASTRPAPASSAPAIGGPPNWDALLERRH